MIMHKGLRFVAKYKFSVILLLYYISNIDTGGVSRFVMLTTKPY